MELRGRCRLLRRLGEGGMGVVHEALAIRFFNRVAERGCCCVPGFARDRYNDPLRELPEFQAVMARATGRHDAARGTVDAAGGYRCSA